MSPALFNRREWLLKTGATSVTLMAAQIDVAQAEDRIPLSLAVISDTHVGYKGGDSAGQRWQATAAEVAQSDAGLVLHLGDVVDGGRVDQYSVYLAGREQISKPVHEIPGNHDPADAFARHLRRDIDTVIDHDWLRCVLLNNARRDSHDGFFAAEQLDWLDRQLAAVARDDRLALICCHVPVHSNRHPDRGWHVKPDQGQSRFYELMSTHREHVLAVLHGHFHNGIRGWTDNNGLNEVSLPSALYNQSRRLEEQNAPGYNLPEFRPGYTLLTAGTGKLTVQYKPTDAAPVAPKILERSH